MKGKGGSYGLRWLKVCISLAKKTREGSESSHKTSWERVYTSLGQGFPGVSFTQTRAVRDTSKTPLCTELIRVSGRGDSQCKSPETERSVWLEKSAWRGSKERTWKGHVGGQLLHIGSCSLCNVMAWLAMGEVDGKSQLGRAHPMPGISPAIRDSSQYKQPGVTLPSPEPMESIGGCPGHEQLRIRSEAGMCG